MGAVVTSDFEFRHQEHKIIYEYWVQQKGQRLAPRRKDFDPLDVPRILPNIFMMDVLYDPLDYKMRLVGTRLVEAMGVNPTGYTFNEVYKGEAGKNLWIEYKQVITDFCVLFSEQSAAWMGKGYARYDRLLLPLSNEEDTQVDILLGVSIFL